jgi:hypothetical protein
VIARLRERMPRASASQPIVCTDCHGMHRLAHRTVVWDRASRELLTGKQTVRPTDNGPNLDTLKELAGTWVQVGPDGKPTDKVVSTYHVTAAGSAVIEVLFPGADHEMVTVYHQDGRELFLTHYCAAGNQPRMKCRAGSAPNQLVFEFVDATNMGSLKDQHMHAETLSIVDKDRLKASWQAYNNGQPAESVEFDLVRKGE